MRCQVKVALLTYKWVKCVKSHLFTNHYINPPPLIICTRITMFLDFTLALVCVDWGQPESIDPITSPPPVCCPALTLGPTTPIEPHLMFWADLASANGRLAWLSWPHKDVNVSWVMLWCSAERWQGGTLFFLNGCPWQALIGPSRVGEVGLTYTALWE